jgi:DNA topoisomerase I
MVELIITEKPAQAEKIAQALADTVPTKKVIKKVPYYELKHNKKDILVGCAVGHLFGLKEIKKKKGWTYPVFDVEWLESYKLKKSSAFSKPYHEVLRTLAKKADKFVVACDYDAEGSVIGYNCVRFIAKKKDARRMKFSTLTKDELLESYKNASKHLDFEIIEAGETRHYLDYYWGISLSRALTLAIKSTGSFKLMTSGRVQGPTLKVIVDKEKEIQKFIPEPFWELHLKAKSNKQEINAQHKKGKFFDKTEVDKVLKSTTDKPAIIQSIEEKEFQQSPPHPFNLTALQTEAYSLFGITPKETLSLAQDLYTAGMISYPRTSSQKLPIALNFKKLLTGLQKQKDYTLLCKELLKLKTLTPNEGKKTDSAHPAIYATGEKSGRLGDRQKKIYDLVVKRFLATFAGPATRKTVTAKIDINNEPFVAKGTTTIKKGWHEFYMPYVTLKEEELPPLKKQEQLKSPIISRLDKETQPPKRYTQASIIKEMEKLNIGTKATRASILDALYKRNYITENSIMATKLGMETVKTLEKNCPDITDVSLTRHFEEEMEQIREKKKTKEIILEEAKKTLIQVLEKFRKKEKEIGEVLIKATWETEAILNTVGECPKCKEGTLKIRSGRFGKFIACDKYPDCKTTFSIPKAALVKPTKGFCKECNFPQVIVIRAGKRPFNYCINLECPPKVQWRKEQEKLKQTKKTAKKTIKKTAKKTTKKATKKKTKK